MMLVTQIDGLFEIDLSNTRISITEENNWFNTQIVANYSLPEELPYSIHPFFLEYQSDNTEDYELEFEVVFNDNGNIHKARFEIIQLHDYTFEFSIFYGWEEFPNWDKKLTELNFDLIEVANLINHANEVNADFYPTRNYYFPCIHTDQYSSSDLNYAAFKGSFNLKDENGDFYVNSIDVENNSVNNLTILRPNVYWLYLLHEVINQAGFELKGDILFDEKLKNLLVVTAKKYEQSDRPETIEWIVGIESYIREGFRHRLGKGWQYGRWEAEQEMNIHGKFKLKGTIFNHNRKHHDIRAYIYLDGKLIFSQSGRRDYSVNVTFTTKKEGSKLSIKAYDYHRDSEKTDFKIVPIEVYAEDGSIIDYVIDSAVIDLKNAIPEAQQGEFIESTMRWFNYDFTVEGKTVTMNKIEKILRRKRNAVNWQKFEAKDKNRTTDSGDSYLLKFKDQSNENFKLTEVFVTKSGIETENFKTNDNTKEIVINAIPLPLTSKNNQLSTTIINDDNGVIYAALRNDSTTDNNTADMLEYYMPNVYEVDYKAFLKFRILTMQYEWAFPCLANEMEHFDIKREILAYNNNHFIKQITREKYRGKETVEVETYMIR